MKRKILFGLGTVIIALAVTVNVSLVNSNEKADITLNNLVGVSTAQAESVALFGCPGWGFPCSTIGTIGGSQAWAPGY